MYVWECLMAASSAILSLSLTGGCRYTWQTQKPFLPHKACVYVIQSCLIKSKTSAGFLLNQTLVNASQFDLKRLYLFTGLSALLEQELQNDGCGAEGLEPPCSSVCEGAVAHCCTLCTPPGALSLLFLQGCHL